MTFKNKDDFGTENHSLSREQVTVFIQVSSTKDISLTPEFIFEGKGTQTKINVTNVNYHRSPSGSYHLEHMLKTIENLPNWFHPFTQKGFVIYVLDDYAVHLTDLHKRLKVLYREEEMNLMLKMLEVDKSKIPSPNRENMIKMLMSLWNAIITDFSQVFKKPFVNNKLDGSEDYLVSDKLFSKTGSKMNDFRDTLIKLDVCNNLQGVV